MGNPLASWAGLPALIGGNSFVVILLFSKINVCHSSLLPFMPACSEPWHVSIIQARIQCVRARRAMAQSRYHAAVASGRRNSSIIASTSQTWQVFSCLMIILVIMDISTCISHLLLPSQCNLSINYKGRCEALHGHARRHSLCAVVLRHPLAVPHVPVGLRQLVDVTHTQEGEGDQIGEWSSGCG